MEASTLHHTANTFLRDHYGLTLHVPIKRNNRLRSTYGRFIIRNGTAYGIELAGVLLDYGTEEVIIHVLKHECIHFALFMKGMPHHDGHPMFEKELQKHGTPSTRQLLIGKFYMLQCTKCGGTAMTNRKRTITLPEKYRMRCCGSKINVIGERIFDGTQNYE